MNDALLNEFEEIQQLWCDTTGQDVLNRYKLAKRFWKVRQGEGPDCTYGMHAVSRLAQALGLSKSTINNYAKVAEVWSLDDGEQQSIAELLQRKDCFGKPVTWSHLVELATVPDAAQRNRLIESTLENGWAVRKLSNAIKAEASAPDADALCEDDVEPQAEPRSDLEAIVQTASENGSWPGCDIGTLEKKLLAAISKTQPESLADAYKQLQKARRELEQMYQARKVMYETGLLQIEERLKLESPQDADTHRRPEGNSVEEEAAEEVLPMEEACMA